MSAKMERIYTKELMGRHEIRVDFDNDRHHAMLISEPYGPSQLADALIQLAHNIKADPYLQD